MIFVTGDTHGDFTRIFEFCNKNPQLTQEDILIILGDAGINYFGDERDIRRKILLKELPITLFCIHGNHEMRPYEAGKYREIEKFYGTVYIEENFPNLIFAKDGEIYNFDGKKIIVLGGAYSIDKWYRLEYGYRWFESEQPTSEIKKYAEQQLKRNDWQVDYVLTHTCPYSYLPREAFLSCIDQSKVDNSTEKWLDTIEKKLSYIKWFCGHFHIEKLDRNLRFLFNEIIELR